MRDTASALVDQLGGAGNCTEAQRLTIRRIAALEAELIHTEAQIAKIRSDGDDPDPSLIDLYARVGNAQRRHIETIGWSGSQRQGHEAQHDLRDVARAIVELLEEAAALEGADDDMAER